MAKLERGLYSLVCFTPPGAFNLALHRYLMEIVQSLLCFEHNDVDSLHPLVVDYEDDNDQATACRGADETITPLPTELMSPTNDALSCSSSFLEMAVSSFLTARDSLLHWRTQLHKKTTIPIPIQKQERRATIYSAGYDIAPILPTRQVSSNPRVEGGEAGNADMRSTA